MSSLFMLYFAVHYLCDSPEQQDDDALLMYLGAGCGSVGPSAASVAGGSLHAWAPEVPVIPLSNIPGCPQPACDTVRAPELVVFVGTPASFGLSHNSEK